MGVIFDQNHSKILKVILNFREFASTCKKSAQFIHSFFIYYVTRVVKIAFAHKDPNVFQSTFNFLYQHGKK